MNYQRPAGTGWIENQAGDPVDVANEPPGDGIGPDLTPPDVVEGMDRREARRLERDHREAVKAASGGYTDQPDIELNESAEEPRTPHPFPKASVSSPQDPEIEQRPEDPREGRGAS